MLFASLTLLYTEKYQEMQNQTGVVWGEKRIGYGFHHITLSPVSELADCPQQVLHRASSRPLSFQ